MSLRSLEIDSPIGTLTAVASAEGLREVLYADEDGRPAEPAHAQPVAPGAPGWDVLQRTGAQLGEYFAGSRRSFDLLLDPEGTDFQLAAWAALETIDHGATATYGEIAAQVGRPGAARAVGGAVGRNPLSIIRPCHRVVGADGSLTGFGGGLDRKRWLLAHEGATLAVAPLDVE